MTTYETLAAATLARASCRSSSRSSRRSRSAARSPASASSPRRSGTGCRTSRCARWTCCSPDGEVVTATPDGEHADLFAAFPNSYGTLGYALRLEIEVQPVGRYVRLEHVRVGHRRPGQGDHGRLRPRTAGTRPTSSTAPCSPATTSTSRSAGSPTTPARAGPSDYTGQQVFYRSIDERAEDVLSVHDYIWRWDTDWFWCSRALGVQHPVVRRLWPRRLAALRRLPPDRRAGPAHRAVRPGPPRCAACRWRSRSCRTSRSRWTGSRSSSTCSTARSASPRCGCARSGCAGSAPGRCTRWPRASCTSTSASGRPSPSGPGIRRRTTASIERAGRRPRRPQVAVLDRPLRRGRVLASATTGRPTAR